MKRPSAIYRPRKPCAGEARVEASVRHVTRSGRQNHSGDLYRQIVQTTHEGIWMADLDAITTFVNPQMARMMRCRPEEMVGRSVFDFVFPENHHAVREHFARYLRLPGGCEVEERLRRKDGSELWAMVAASVFRDDSGWLAGFLGMFTDTTERKRIEVAERQQENERLHHRIRERTAENVELEREILTISEEQQQRLGRELHDDVCQRLACIEFLSQRLAKRLQSDNGHAGLAAEVACMVQETMTRTRELARGLLPLDFEGQDLARALKVLAERTRRVYGIKCHCEATGPTPAPGPVTAFHVYRIAQEAVSNAVKHSRAKCIEIRLSAGTAQLELIVRDNGIGLLAKFREGLGLRTMRYRTEVLDGQFSVQRTQEGTEVRCSVPVAAACNAGRAAHHFSQAGIHPGEAALFI